MLKIFFPYSPKNRVTHLTVTAAGYFLLCILMLSASLAVSQSPAASDFTSFLKSLEREPDSVRFSKLTEYALDMTDQLRIDNADRATGEMMRIAGAANNKGWIGRTFMTRGTIERNQNNHSPAILNYQKAQGIFHATGELRREIRALQRIGGVYMVISDLKMADYYFQQAFKIAKDNKIPVEMAHLYVDFATTSDIRKDFNKALAYSDSAIRIYKQQGEDFSAALFNRGIIFKNAGRYSESVEIYKQSLDYAKKQGDLYFEQMIYLNLPNTLVRMDRLDEAETYLEKAMSLAKKSPDRARQYMYAYETMRDIYEKRGQFDKAFAYQKQWIVYRDSVFNSEKSRQLIEAETKFQTKEKQKRIAQLNDENLEKKRQLWWLYGGLSLLVLLLGISLWQYTIIRRGNRRLGLTNKTLSEANHQISLQSAQLKELMQELHHRVKNNLAIVSSLLSLQANRLEDEAAVKAIIGSQQRVEAMSLVHEQLYQSENVTGVSMKDYIEDLVRGLMQSFQFKENFNLSLDIEPIVLDVKSAVPLGLILNELITNAFKHAYQDVTEPGLSIRLWQDQQLFLEIRDNGPGLEEADWRKPGSSFGRKLVNSLVKQANGKLTISNENGARFLLMFPPVK